MGRIDRQTIQRILDAADIVEVVSDFVKLRRSGANYKGLCPFHNERTPSFSVNKARNICKCFSCGKGGSPVNFIMEHEQMTYQEALRYLARKYNIEIVETDVSEEDRREQNEREAMLALNKFALDRFEKNLHDTPEGQAVALPYFRHRGLNDAMIARFHLGYSVDRNSDLADAAISAGFNPKYLTETGLAGVRQREGEGGGKLYDRYRGRVIFPIHSVSGRVVGFGARTMRSDKNIAKYVNSPESLIYHKNMELYGFYQAKSAIAKADKCIMVEGYLDVISMHQAGVENVVASSGTSLTEGQIRAVRRFTDNITLIYDADAAGIKASLRGIKMLLAEKMNVRVLSLPPGDDPDSFAQSHSGTEVEEYLRTHETDIISFMTRVLLAGINNDDPTARAKVINTVLETVAYVDEPVKLQEYITLCSHTFGMSEQVLLRQLNIFITRRREEDYKERQREAARATLQNSQLSSADKTEDNAAGKTSAEASASASGTTETEAPLLDVEANHLEPYERMIARYLVRYGLCYIGTIAKEDGTIISATVYDFIEAELTIADNIPFTVPAYAKIFKAVGELRHGTWDKERASFCRALDSELSARADSERMALASKGISMDAIAREEQKLQKRIEEERSERIDAFDTDYCRTRLLNSPDDELRTAANRLATDRYVISRIFNDQTNREDKQLRSFVPRAVNELRDAILRDILTNLNRRLSTLDPNDVATANEILSKIQLYKEKEKKFCKVLGERIILPGKS